MDIISNKGLNMIESRKLSLIKTISWGIIAMIAGYLIAITLNIPVKTSLVLILSLRIVYSILFYIHERMLKKSLQKENV